MQNDKTIGICHGPILRRGKLLGSCVMPERNLGFMISVLGHNLLILNILERIDSSSYAPLCIFLAAVLGLLAIVCLGLFMLFGSLRMYLAPIALALMWYGTKDLSVRLESRFQETPKNSSDLIRFEMGKLSVRLTFAWLTGAVMFSVIDIAQFFHGDYFDYDVYALLMGVLLALTVGVYVQSRDPMVAWIALWDLPTERTRSKVN